MLIEDEETLEALQEAAWRLLKSDAQLHPTIERAVADDLTEWLNDKLEFDQIYWAAHDADPENARDELRHAVRALLALASRAETILDDVHDTGWTAPVQTVLREVASIDELGEIVGELEWPHGKIQACINFSFDDAIDRHVIENCSDEETLEEWRDSGRRDAEEQWEQLRSEALSQLRQVVDSLEAVKTRLLANLEPLRQPVDNTGPA